MYTYIYIHTYIHTHTQDPPRWRICLHTLNSFLPMTVGAVYKDATLRRDSAASHDAHTLLKLLRAEFDHIISNSEWMSPASRKVARQKLSLMDFQIGGSAHVEPLPWAVRVFVCVCVCVCVCTCVCVCVCVCVFK